jgi:peptidoglycan/LPS O-acetylase OafA/YrhL
MPAARNHALDGLRGLAALGVLTLHVWMYTEQPTHDRGDLLSAVAGELRQGVVLFFVLSGFLLAGPWVASALDGRRSPRLAAFARRRVARIGPAYWVAMLGSFALLAGSGHHYEIGAGQLPVFAVFAQNYVPSTHGRLDPPMWSLVVEVSFYVALPLLGWMLVRAGRRGRMVAACAALVALGLTWTALGHGLAWPRTVMTSLPTYLPVFACGIAAAVLAHGRSPGRRACAALALGGAALIVGDGWWHHGGHTGALGQIVRDLPAAAGFAAIVAAIAARPPALLSCAPLRGLGTISYALYLWHVPVIVWLRFQDALPADDFAGGVARVTIVTAAIAWASWVLVERPIIQRATRRRRAAAPPRPQPAPSAA